MHVNGHADASITTGKDPRVVNEHADASMTIGKDPRGRASFGLRE